MPSRRRLKDGEACRKRTRGRPVCRGPQFEIDAEEDPFYDLVIGVAEGRVSKAAVTVFLEEHVA